MTSVAHARWLIYGGNSSLLPVVKGIRPKAEIHNLNPFDRRASAWDIPADAQTPGQTRQIAAAFIRDDQDETQYAVEAQRALVAAAIEALHTMSSSNWGLSHLLAALRPEAIEAVLCEYSTTREVYENYLGRYSPDDAAELLALLQSKLQPFYPIAAAWQHTRKHMSLRSWANSHDILVLGNDRETSTDVGTTELLPLMAHRRHPVGRFFLRTGKNLHLPPLPRTNPPCRAPPSSARRRTRGGCNALLGHA